MIWIVTSITGSIIGSATSKWFDKTALGRWFNKKVETWYNWAAKRYGLQIIKAEDKWKKKHPHIAEQLSFFVYTSASTVGFPLLSNTWRATTFKILFI